MPLSALSAALDELIAEGAAAHSDGASIIALMRERARLAALLAAAEARLDGSQEQDAGGT